MSQTPSPPGRKRRGRLSKDEQARCVELCRVMIGYRQPESAISREVEKVFGIRAESAAPYIEQARNELREEVGQSVAEHVRRSFGVYQALIADPNVDAKDKVKAQNSIDRLLGLAQPGKVEHITREEPLSRREALKRMTEEELLTLEATLAKASGRTPIVRSAPRPCQKA